MSPENPLFPHRFTRRTGFIVLGAAALALTGIAVSRQPVTADLVNAGKAVRAFETGIGDQPLVFDEAKEYADILSGYSGLYQAGYFDVGDIQKRTFIARGQFPDKQAESEFVKAIIDGKDPQNEVADQLLKDYPSFNMTPERAEALGWEAIGHVTGFVEEGNEYLFLNEINYESTNLREDIPFLQYSGINLPVGCLSARPVVDFRSAKWHEDTHLINDARIKSLDHSIQAAIVGLKNRDPNRPKISKWKKANKSNFSIQGELEDGERIRDHRLDELNAEYNQAEMAESLDLPYTVTYVRAVDLANFRTILTQSEISSKKLNSYHQGSDLEGFFIKIAEGAKEIVFDSRQDKVNFSVERLQFKLDSYNDPDFIWAEFGPYFSGLDLNVYNGMNSRSLMYPMFYDSPPGLEYQKRRAMAGCMS